MNKILVAKDKSMDEFTWYEISRADLIFCIEKGQALILKSRTVEPGISYPLWLLNAIINTPNR